mmetsp:Transcript_83029/g.239873  ORF Transcript_83029/g.239873 Transcript_83029/m.239873 type:complete len:624 (-) Transcript_83029:166-2037(-)
MQAPGCSTATQAATSSAGRNMSSAEALLGKARRFRDVDNIQHESVPDVPASLAEIAMFLQSHETQAASDATHAVFDNFPDWWQGHRSTFRLAISGDDGDLDVLYEHIATLYKLNIPLTLSEIRTPQMLFAQDIHVRGSENSCLTAEDLFGKGDAFAKLLGSIMGEIFPNNDFLDVAIFDASGHSRRAGAMKTSIRIVWSSVVVDRVRARRIRDFIVYKFKESQDPAILALAERLQKLGQDNAWASVFDESVYASKHGVRMPLNDLTSPAPLKKPERRPFKPYAVVRFAYGGGSLQHVTNVAQEEDLDGPDWLQLGCLRQKENTPLTEWTAPVLPGDLQRPGGQDNRAGSGGRDSGSGSGYGGLVRMGRVSVRTHGGSAPNGDGNKRLTAKPRDDRVTQEHAQRVELEFDGTAEDFLASLEAHFGRQDAAIVAEDDLLTWTQSELVDGSKIQFRPSTRRVYVQGRMHQVRHLLVTVRRFARDVRDSVGGPSALSSRGVTALVQGADAGPAPSAFSPSAYFAPSAAFAPIAPSSGTARTADSGALVQQPTSIESTRRLVQHDFTGQTTGELTLTQGQVVLLTNDPQPGDHSSPHRWVYGMNEASGQKGWFPLSYTVPREPAGRGE